jgi:hypothetical protein
MQHAFPGLIENVEVRVEGVINPACKPIKDSSIKNNQTFSEYKYLIPNIE